MDTTVTDPKAQFARQRTLALAALGIVFGDIGTSPLYALKEVFAHGHVPLTPQNIYGVLSLVFLTLTVVVSLKYVALILRADNNGEGGTLALMALAQRAVGTPEPPSSCSASFTRCRSFIRSSRPCRFPPIAVRPSMRR